MSKYKPDTFTCDFCEKDYPLDQATMDDVYALCPACYAKHNGDEEPEDDTFQIEDYSPDDDDDLYPF